MVSQNDRSSLISHWAPGQICVCSRLDEGRGLHGCGAGGMETSQHAQEAKKCWLCPQVSTEPLPLDLGGLHWLYQAGKSHSHLSLRPHISNMSGYRGSGQYHRDRAFFLGTRHQRKIKWPEENKKINTHQVWPLPRQTSPRGWTLSIISVAIHSVNIHRPCAICLTQDHRHPAPNTCKKNKWVRKLTSLAARVFLWVHKSLSSSRNNSMLYTEHRLCAKEHTNPFTDIHPFSVLQPSPCEVETVVLFGSWGQQGSEISTTPRTDVIQPAQGRAGA